MISNAIDFFQSRFDKLSSSFQHLSRYYMRNKLYCANRFGLSIERIMILDSDCHVQDHIFFLVLVFIKDNVDHIVYPKEDINKLFFSNEFSQEEYQLIVLY